MPTPRTDPRLEAYGDYRRLANAPVVTYLLATVDNQSDDTINMFKVVVVTNDGRQIEATSVSDFVDSWRDAFAGEGGDASKYNRGIQLSNKSQFYLLPGAKGIAFLATDAPIPSVKRVFVYPSGAFDRVEAHRTGFRQRRTGLRSDPRRPSEAPHRRRTLLVRHRLRSPGRRMALDRRQPSRHFALTGSDALPELVAAYQAECARSRSISTATVSLDTLASGEGMTFNLRYALTHLIEETSRHLSHLDLLRESIDGSTGE